MLSDSFAGAGPTLPHVTPTASAKKVACVGDSITAGYLSSCGLNYPGWLQSMLGPGYKVTNYVRLKTFCHACAMSMSLQ